MVSAQGLNWLTALLGAPSATAARLEAKLGRNSTPRSPPPTIEIGLNDFNLWGGGAEAAPCSTRRTTAHSVIGIKQVCDNASIEERVLSLGR